MKQFEVELREESGREPTLSGVMLQEGRAATGGRSEIFTPGSVEWPSHGIAIKTVHRGETETRAHVTRDRDGRLLITARASRAVVKAFEAGKRFLSVEFRSLDERTTAAGVREILRAFVDAAALTYKPEYDVAAAEVRSRSEDTERKARLWL